MSEHHVPFWSEQRLRLWARRACCLLVLMAFACTETDLEKLPEEPERRDDKLAVSGELCTRKPETLTFPLRVMFIVDSSVSMQVTDPADPISGETGRERAVRETWERLLEQGAQGVQFSIIRFSSQAQPQTGVDTNGDGLADTYFTADRTRLEAGTAALADTNRTTNYVNALGEAYFEIRNELVNADQESLALSKYQVIFLSDGLPDVDSSEQRGNSSEQILDSVASIRELVADFGVREFSFNTAYLASGQQSFDQAAQELLQRMAEVGGGKFRSFPSGEALNFLFVDFTVLRRIFTLKALAAVNLNAVQDEAQLPEWVEALIAAANQPDSASDAGLDVGATDAGGMDATMTPDATMMSDAGPDAGAPVDDGPPESVNPFTFVDVDGNDVPRCGEALADSDGDGLSDLREIELESNPLQDDTDDDGLNDLLEWRFRESGFDLLDPEDSQCYVPEQCIDDDGDGFCDCVRDSDADGVCNCEEEGEQCADDMGHDCVDEDEDGFCDCPDLDDDGRCDYDDSDGDGLHDCEEVFYGTAQNGADSDADGIPDPVEARFQTNPVEADLQDDIDADRTPNGIELLGNTDPNCDDSAVRSRLAYRYRVDELGINKGQTCYDFGVENITLVPTIANDQSGYPGNGWNRVLLFAGEVAFDAPGSFAGYRVACVMANYYPDGNYKNPPSGRFSLTEGDFKDVEEFDPDEDCIYP